MTVVLDDHLLRDWLSQRDPPLVDAVAGDEVATTNLWYARLCKSAAGETPGALAGSWTGSERDGLRAAMAVLTDDVDITPMRVIAWEMGELIAAYQGLSMLGAEAVAASRRHRGRLLVSSRDVGAGIRRCCEDLEIPFQILHR